MPYPPHHGISMTTTTQSQIASTSTSTSTVSDEPPAYEPHQGQTSPTGPPPPYSAQSPRLSAQNPEIIIRSQNNFTTSQHNRCSQRKSPAIQKRKKHPSTAICPRKDESSRLLVRKSAPLSWKQTFNARRAPRKAARERKPRESCPTYHGCCGGRWREPA